MLHGNFKKKIKGRRVVQCIPNAEWEWNPNTMTLSCSQCGEGYDFDSVDTALTFMDSVKYCMNCGARFTENARKNDNHCG